MIYTSSFNYRGKKISLEIGGKHNGSVSLEHIINLEFYSDKIYTILRIPFKKEDVSELETFSFNKNKYLLIKNISIAEKEYKDENFEWIEINNLNLKIFIDDQNLLPYIEILIRNNIDGTISYIAATSDRISEDMMHKIILNL